MTNQAIYLYKLQDIDLRILKIERRYQEIVAVLRDDAEIKTAKEALEAIQAGLPPQQTHYQELERQIQSVNEKKASTEQRLYSGEVTIPKELQDMQNEVTALTRRIAELEANLLEALATIETTQSRIDKAQAKFDVLRDARKTSHEALHTERKDLKEQAIALQEERTHALKPITEASLREYTELKPQKNHQPVSRLNDESCSICGIEQISTILEAVRKGDRLINCKNCQRILVAL